MAEQIVAVVLGALAAAAAVVPWAWNRRGGLRGSIANIVLAGRWRLLRSFVPYYAPSPRTVRNKGA